MPGTPHPPASEELAWLRARVAELEAVNARLREAARARDELAAAQLAALAAQVEELRRRLDKDSSTSSKPPSSDSPYTKKPKDRSLRGRSGRKPGKQPGAPSSTLKQSPDPGQTVFCGPVLAAAVFAHESAAFGVDVLAGVGDDLRPGCRAGVGSGCAEEAGERGDGFE